MAVKIPIRERIARELKARVVAALPGWMDQEIEAGTATAAEKAAAVCERLNPQGNDPPVFSPVVIPGPAVASPAGDGGNGGDGGLVEWTAEYVVQVFLPVVEGSALEPETMQNRWVAYLEAALSEDVSLVETETGDHLAENVEPTGHDTPLRVKEQSVVDYVAEVAFDVQYSTYRGNPYEGPGNTERTE